MLVSHRKNFIFTKSVKTGSSSVEVALQDYCVAPGETVPQTPIPELVSEHGIVGSRLADAKSAKFYSHMAASQIRKFLPEKVWSSYHKFTIVRNPFDKVVSWFHFQFPQSKVLSHKEIVRRFNTWLDDPETALPVDRDKYLIQDEFVLDSILRYEHLSDDLEALCSKLHCPIDTLPRLKSEHRSGVKKHYRLYYSSRSEARVAEEFAYEMERFGYQF